MELGTAHLGTPLLGVDKGLIKFTSILILARSIKCVKGIKGVKGVMGSKTIMSKVMGTFVFCLSSVSSVPAAWAVVL
jgi:hypothetical protein